ncbi:MAG: CBS domain-containing protein [Pseudomonadota bacterium]
MNVSSILKTKGDRVVTARPDWTVSELSRQLKAERIGALVVSEDDSQIAGIVSERDIVRCLAEKGAAALDCRVDDIMQADVVTVTPDVAIEDVMATMTGHRIRHLPVVVDGKLAGIISIGDVVKHRLEALESETEAMRHYIAGH